MWNPAVQKVAEQMPENRILIETDGMEAVDWAYEEGKKQGFLKEKKENLQLNRTVGFWWTIQDSNL